MHQKRARIVINSMNAVLDHASHSEQRFLDHTRRN